MHDYIHDVTQQALDNTYYRHVLHTGDTTQTVVMCIAPDGEIGMETHPDNEQVLFIVSGKGTAVLDGQEQEVSKADVIVVRPGVEHNVRNSGLEDLKIITVYAPPHHKDGVIHSTKAEADADKDDKPGA